MGNPIAAVALRNIIVQIASDLQGAETGQLPEGALASVATDGNNTSWRFTKADPLGTLANIDGANYVKANQGWWVAEPTRIFELALVGGTLTISDLFLATVPSSGLGGVQVLVTVLTPGGTQGFLSVVVANNSVTINSTSTSETSTLSIVIFPNVTNFPNVP
jgi:hypothetical protein